MGLKHIKWQQREGIFVKNIIFFRKCLCNSQKILSFANSKNNYSLQKHYAYRYIITPNQYIKVMKTSKMTTDDELVRRYENGEDSAFDVLLERHQEKLYNYIFFLVHDKDTSDDIFQETFVRAITCIRTHRYTENGYFYAWLIRIAHNLIHDTYYQKGIMPMVSQDICGEHGDMCNDVFNDVRMCEPNVEALMLQQQSFDDLHIMMSHLPQNQQQIIYMRFFQGLSFKEIAEDLGVSINTALGRVRYAILNLRKMATKKDFYLAV